MFKKTIYFFAVTTLIIIGFTAITIIAGKIYFTNTATQKANNIIAAAIIDNNMTYDEEVIAITRLVSQRFESLPNPSKDLLSRLRPYISNKRLPDFIRFDEGVIETYLEKGMCDNAARMLHFILKQKGYKSIQWNIVTNVSAHSALLVYMPDTRKVLVDPLYALVAFDSKSKKLISPEQLHKGVREGKSLDTLLLKLSDESDYTFYNDLSSAHMAKSGEKLHITADIPKTHNTPVFLGKIDGNSRDVKSAAINNKMTPFWYYAGHKYDRSWVRTLKTDQDIRLEITLVSDIEDGIITSEPRPNIVDKNKMIWNLKSGDKISFIDGKAKINWQRLNSFIGIDQIAIYPTF